MSLGINVEEMLATGYGMGYDRELMMKLGPMLYDYRRSLDISHQHMLEYDECDILYAQFKARVNVYKKIIEDLESLVPVWLKSEYNIS